MDLIGIWPHLTGIAFDRYLAGFDRYLAAVDPNLTVVDRDLACIRAPLCWKELQFATMAIGSSDWHRSSCVPPPLPSALLLLISGLVLSKNRHSRLFVRSDAADIH